MPVKGPIVNLLKNPSNFIKPETCCKPIQGFLCYQFVFLEPIDIVLVPTSSASRKERERKRQGEKGERDKQVYDKH